MSNHDHIPTAPVGNIGEALQGLHRMGRDSEGDKMYRNILCISCGQHIKLAGTMMHQGDGWELVSGR